MYQEISIYRRSIIEIHFQNSTAIFNRLYKLMKHQSNSNSHDYLVSSVEEGIRLIKQGSTKAILGGRETLYFNMKRYGKKWISLKNPMWSIRTEIFRNTKFSTEWKTLHKIFSGGSADWLSIFGKFERSVCSTELTDGVVVFWICAIFLDWCIYSREEF